MTKPTYPENVSYREHVTFGKEEVHRRRQSQLVRRGADVQRLLEELDYRDPVALVDPGIGFHTRTLRMFMNRVAPKSIVDQPGSSGWKERRGAGGGKKFGHRHTVEAVIYYLKGQGYSIIDGVRYDWQAGDFLCVPVFAWHRHVNTGDEPSVHIAGVTVPFHKAIGLSVFEDEGFPDQWVFAQQGEVALGSLIPGVAEGAPPPDEGAATQAERLYRGELRYAYEEEQRRRTGKVLVRTAELSFEETSLGRMAYVVDPRIGFNVKVIATHMLELLPSRTTTVHRHTYEEICYILSGEGLSVIGDGMVRWAAGDTLFVPPLEWHQHSNEGQEPARLLVHTNRPLTENIGLALTQHHPGDAATGQVTG